MSAPSIPNPKLAAAATVSEASLIRANLFTPLKNDDHPCVAENLKVSEGGRSARF